MRVDISLYSVNKEPARKWHRDNALDLGQAAGRMSIFTGAPILVCLFWLGEFDGFSEELLDRMRGLVVFYGCEEIVNVPANFNYDIGVRCTTVKP